MRLLVQPGDGCAAIVEAIGKARSSVEIVIFRLDCGEVERALKAAAERGVRVHALIAFTNRGGEKGLRRLESRLLACGVQVTRTADDLVRYHGKMVILDRRLLLLLAFNFTRLDLQSRSFGIITRHRRLVRAAVQLFEADCQRVPYVPATPSLVVSPVNARERLAAFLRGARRQLLIYDVEISDPAILQLLRLRVRHGVEVRILGAAADATLAQRRHSLRLHARCIVRDRRQVFVGSQSLRTLELDGRREIGAIVGDVAIAAAVSQVFEKDWHKAKAPAQAVPDLAASGPPTAKALKKMMKAIRRELPPAPALTEAIEGAVHGRAAKAAVKDVVKDVVKEAVKEAVLEVVGAPESFAADKPAGDKTKDTKAG